MLFANDRGNESYMETTQVVGALLGIKSKRARRPRKRIRIAKARPKLRWYTAWHQSPRELGDLVRG